MIVDIRAHNAIVATVLHEYILDRAQHQERVSQLAASRIIATAERLGLHHDRNLRLLGFELEGEYVSALSRVKRLDALTIVTETRNARRVLALTAMFRGRSVADLECMGGGKRREVPPDQAQREARELEKAVRSFLGVHADEDGLSREDEDDPVALRH